MMSNWNIPQRKAVVVGWDLFGLEVSLCDSIFCAPNLIISYLPLCAGDRCQINNLS